MTDWPTSVTARQVKDAYDILGLPDHHWSVTQYFEILADPWRLTIRRLLVNEDGKPYADPATGETAAEEHTIPIDWSVR